MQKKKSISDFEGHYDIDGVSFESDAGVIVASDASRYNGIERESSSQAGDGVIREEGNSIKDCFERLTISLSKLEEPTEIALKMYKNEDRWIALGIFRV